MNLSFVKLRIRNLAQKARAYSKTAKTYEARIRCVARAQAYENCVEWLKLLQEDQKQCPTNKDKKSADSAGNDG